jgi:hypothetical protein
MPRKPLGCLTGLALLSAALTAVVLVGAALATGNGIFAPGPLNAQAGAPALNGVSAHAELGDSCGACHAAPLSGETMAARCLACHTTVSDELASSTGLHGRFATSGECRTCHTDHHGATASLTLANPADFPHERTGYSLAAHPMRAAAFGPAFVCADCHTTSVARFEPTTCATCHSRLDPPYMAAHLATFGETCRSCHDGVDTFGKAFGHATWALEGKHATAECSGCHQGARDVAAFEATKTDCLSCHTKDDVHQGLLGTDCASCHTAAGWEATAEAFDHAKTAFALDGRHTGVECLACHTGRRWTGIGTTCEACHGGDKDPHKGQFKQACSSCHTPADWKAVTFDHDTTGFALAGAHATPACAACHAGGTYAGTPRTCIGCHRADDAHEGNLGIECAECHRVTTWQDTTFRHDQSSFKLTGTHATALCSSCHASLTMYRGRPTTCFACHKGDDVHSGGMGTDCSRCHTTKTWKGASFDHSRTGFPLTGSHAAARCAQCHTKPDYADVATTCIGCHRPDDTHGGNLPKCATCHTTSAWKPSTFSHGSTGFKLTGAHASATCLSCHHSNRYRDTPNTCYACHKARDAHAGKFGTSCGACHSTKAWTPASVDHDKTDFPLTGAHRGVSCAKCHVNSVYSGTPKTCRSCHSKPTTHAPDPFSVCSACHTTGAWKPAEYNAPHTFPMTHRTAGGVCSRCHPSTWASYTCSRCHDNATMDEHHKEVANYSRTTCARCHPAGRNN